MKSILHKKHLLLPLLLLVLLSGCGPSSTLSNNENSLFNNTSSDSSDDIPLHEDGRTIVTLSVYHATDNSDIAIAVASFNKTNPDYYVELLTADKDTSASDYWERERIEIMAGKGPDIFTKNAQSEFMAYVEKGVIEDLAPYIERDINKENYWESSLYAYEYEGRVYAIEPNFSISFLAGSKEIFGNSAGWNLEEMIQIMEEQPEILFFENHSGPGSFLRDYLAFGSVDYTDYDAIRACIEFDKTYCRELPADIPAIPGQSVLVTSEDLHSIIGWADCEALYGQELVPIGYVNEQKEGILHSSIAWSINSASKQKEGAWAFLKFLLSEEYQRECHSGYLFSPLKAIWEEQMEFCSKPITNTFYVEELGETITTTRNHTLSRASGASFPDTVEIECMTEEQLQTVVNMIERAKINCFTWDQTAIQIITEEAQAYFCDKRSLDDIMVNIQNRIDLYMSEKQ